MSKAQNTIDRIAIVGGTHGNEPLGVYLLMKFQKYPHLVDRESFETITLIANTEAFISNKRYLDQDLNRSFNQDQLNDLTLNNHENKRAKYIYSLLGRDGISPIDVLIDIHTTTSNMGLTLITYDNFPFNLQLCAYLQNINPLINIYTLEKTEKSSSLPAICPLGITIEVGPISQGTVDAELFQKTEELINITLNYLEQYNKEENPSFKNKLTVYRHKDIIDFPRESGEIQGMIHPKVQNYKPLNPGDPLFVTFEGETIVYEGNTTVYPIFVNEAAYYETGIAMATTDKLEITV